MDRLIAVSLLVQLGVSAAIASALVRSKEFKNLLFNRSRTLTQTIYLVIWICLPFARPGVGYLFPWWRREGRRALLREAGDLWRGRLPGRDELSPLVGTVQGLGLCALSGSVVGGMISYLAYFRGVPMSDRFLHEVALEQIVMSWLVWAFVSAHVTMAVRHFLVRAAPPGPVISAQPDTGAS